MITTDNSQTLVNTLAAITRLEADALPLSDEQLRTMHHEDQFGLFCDYDDFEQIARAIEQAHGIKEQP